MIRRRGISTRNTGWRRLDFVSFAPLVAMAFLTLTFAAASAAEIAKKPPAADGQQESPGGNDEDDGEARDAPGAERDPELIDPGPEGCPFNDRQLELIV